MKLNKTSDHSSKVPFTMSGLTGQGKDDGSKISEVNDAPSNQTNPVKQRAKEVFDGVPLQMVIPIIIQGNVSKTKPL